MDFEKLGLFYLGELLDADTKERTGTPLLYKSSALTTHAVIVGMTGSGKTGLGIGMIEEAAIDRIPVLAIDPKGDLPNLALTFPEFQAEDFAPWIDPHIAEQKGLTVEEFATREARTWKEGLQKSGQSGDRIRKFRETPVTVYTPGSNAGIPISIVQSLNPPKIESLHDPKILEQIGGVVDSVLTLLGKSASPFTQEHVLLSTIIQERWRLGLPTSLQDLVHLVQQPPLQQIGVLDIETFYPERDRKKLALQLNTIIAAPTFQTWLTGVPLDIDSLLFDEAGNPAIAIVSLNHLNEREQHFFLTLLLTEFTAWTRSQTGTGALRAMLYMDELFGFLPPVALPATKKPLLSLLKQARAFGVGLTLCTQNPVDIDYKALGNAGTWFIGRLQTEQDRSRLLQGLSTGGSRTPQALMNQVASLGKREFLMHNVAQSEPEVFYTRWAMSYLAGPLTLEQIRKLPQPRTFREFTEQFPKSSSLHRTFMPPVVSPEIPQRYVGDGDRFEPHVLVQAEVHYSSKPHSIEHTAEVSQAIPIPAHTLPESWSNSTHFPEHAGSLATTPPSEVSFGALPVFPPSNRALHDWEQGFKRWLSGEGALKLWHHPELKLTGEVGESENSFRQRCDIAVHELRDEKRQKITDRYASRFNTLERRLLTQRHAVVRHEESQKRSQLDTYISLGSALLSSFLSGRKPTASSVSSAMRKATGQSSKQVNIDAAHEQLAQTEQEFIDLQAEFDRELVRLADEVAQYQSRPLDTISIRPLASSIHITYLGLLWVSSGTTVS